MRLMPALLGIEELISWLATALAGLWSMVLLGIKRAFLWLFDLGIALTGWLPNHAPIAWPDPGSWGLLFRGLAVVSRFVDLPVLFGVLGLGITYTVGVLVYSVYRLALGFFPAAK